MTAKNGKGLSLRDEQKRLTRRRLIEGALAAFERKGYAATTIDDIVAEANASRATFYLHFKSKADVVLVVTADARPALARAVRRAHVRRAPRRASELYAWLDAHGRATTRPTARAWTPSTRPSRSSPRSPRCGWPTSARAIAVMAESIQRWSGADEEDARVRAALLLAQMDRFFDLWVIRGLEFDRERAVATLTDQWLAVLGAGARKRTRSRR